MGPATHRYDGLMKEDSYARSDYRRMIAWPARIEREAPLLLDLFGAIAPRRLLDLGSGTGEHAWFLASRGLEVVGIDASDSMIESSREPLTGGPDTLPAGTPPPRFIHGDIREVSRLTDGAFGGAICLGNMLPHLHEEADLAMLFGGLRERLAGGSLLLMQILNYERIIRSGQRHLPLNFRQDDEGELLFLRLMEAMENEMVLFIPSTLRIRPDSEVPLEVVSSRAVPLRAWRRDRLERLLEESGFKQREVFGGIDRSAFDSVSSGDLLIVAR
jgi:glycine/sarcosine N-methyltransferase